MNWNQIEGQWNEMSALIKARWQKLTDEDLKVVAGKKDELAGKIQERYGVPKDDADLQIDTWTAKVKAVEKTS